MQFHASYMKMISLEQWYSYQARHNPVPRERKLTVSLHLAFQMLYYRKFHLLG